MTEPPRPAGVIQRNAFAILFGVVAVALVVTGIGLGQRQVEYAGLILALLGIEFLVLRARWRREADDALRASEAATQALLGVIDDVLDYSKIEAGRTSLETVPFDLQSVLDATESAVALRAEQKALALRRSVAPDVPPRLTGDPLRLSRVLINLTTNAVKLAERGEVVMSVGVVSREAEHVTLRFDVRDSGTWFSSDGFSLGFALPAAAARGGESAWHGVERRAVPLPGVRVLVAEDNDVNQFVAREILESCGAVVEIARDGVEAVTLACAPGAHFDAVLMDLHMPGLDGYEAARRMRANPATTHLPIIAMTAPAHASERQRCLEAGMNDHITKPIDPDYLASVLAHWVSRSLTVVNRATPRPPGATMRRRRSDGARPAIDFASAQTRVGGSRELLLRLLGDFSRDFAAAPAEIRRALQRGDVDSARRQVQTLKGTASNLSVTRVHAAAVSVEKAMRAGSADRALALMDQLEAVLASALQAVSALQSPPGNGATPRDEGNGSRPEYRNGARHNGVTLEREIAHE